MRDHLEAPDNFPDTGGFQVTSEIDSALMVRGFLVSGVALIRTMLIFAIYTPAA